MSCNDAADAYKLQQSDGKWLFGIRGAWLLAPTRHGAHNWEHVGHLTALSAVRALSDMVEEQQQQQQQQLWSGVLPPDSMRLISAGHSMGGHGAYTLALHR